MYGVKHQSKNKQIKSVMNEHNVMASNKNVTAACTDTIFAFQEPSFDLIQVWILMCFFIIERDVKHTEHINFTIEMKHRP